MPKKHNDLITPINLRAFGQQVYAARNDAHLQVNQVAGILGVSEIFVRQIEMGKRLPSLTVFMNLCNALHVSPAYLLVNEIALDVSDPVQMALDLLSECPPRQGVMVMRMLQAASESVKDSRSE